MPILNAKNNMFTIWFPPHFFYPSVKRKWQTTIERLQLPYRTVEDFFNASIQSVTIPPVDLPTVEQIQSQFAHIKYKGGKELEPTWEKHIDVVFKLAEGFITYWIIFDQIEEYLKYDSEESDLFWPAMYVSFLDMQGRELVAFEFNQIIPTSLSQFDVSYATTAAEFNTFTLGLDYNRFNIKRRTDDENIDISNS